WFLGAGYGGVALLLLAGAAALIVAAYVLVARQGGEAIDGTTETAALLVLALGVVAGLGYPLVTSAIASVMVLALAEKTQIHGAIRRLDERELKAALQFAVLALVVLPLLPPGPYGPFDSIRPRALWAVVLIFSALNFIGYGASRALGTHRGYILSGLLGGTISSTAVTLQFARKSRDEAAAGRALALGVVGACTVLPVRVTILTALLNPAMAVALAPSLVPPFLAGAALLVVGWLRHEDTAEPVRPEIRNPLGLLSSLRMALAFQVVLTALGLVQARLGEAGVHASAAVLGLTDVDALTYAMSRLGATADLVRLGARGVAIGVLSNTVLKGVMAAVIGRGGFRGIAVGGLIGLALASAGGLWLLR
ncbi:MAG TPA: DUF4010 domain-containing protein, partial [Gemmatimonadales bacterium]|nr:DUF4010 domain-containing protein [Gemmatimonadales bacterium]